MPPALAALERAGKIMNMPKEHTVTQTRPAHTIHDPNGTGLSVYNATAHTPPEITTEDGAGHINALTLNAGTGQDVDLAAAVLESTGRPDLPDAEVITQIIRTALADTGADEDAASAWAAVAALALAQAQRARLALTRGATIEGIGVRGWVDTKYRLHINPNGELRLNHHARTTIDTDETDTLSP